MSLGFAGVFDVDLELHLALRIDFKPAGHLKHLLMCFSILQELACLYSIVQYLQTTPFPFILKKSQMTPFFFTIAYQFLETVETPE